MGVGKVDIDPLEKVLVHEIAVALIVRRGQSDVFVEVYRAYRFKRDRSGAKGVDQRGVPDTVTKTSESTFLPCMSFVRPIT